MATTHKIGITTILLLVSFFSTSVFGQKNTIYRFKADGYYGWSLSDNGNCYGGELGMELPLFGNRNWEYTYNFPTLGFATGYLKINEPEFMHHAIHAYPYFHWAIVHTNRFALNLKWGGGLAGIINQEGYRYDYFPITGFACGGLNMDFALGTKFGNPLSQWIINIGADVMAYFNGNVTLDAQNCNLANLKLGLKYTPNVWPLPIDYPAKPVDRCMALEIYGTAGANQLERKQDYYINAAINAGLYLPLSNAYRIGLAADCFFNDAYDGTQRTINTRYNFIKENRMYNRIRAGVALANEITTHRVNVGLHVGIYCFSKIKFPKYDENGEKYENRIENILYTKAVTRFYFTPKFFGIIELKTHLLKVECLQMGLGWAMPDFGKRVKNPFERISFKKEDKEELRID
ncbi:MAG: hypothetical protein J6C20_07030 [Paludibacteraceae bacterium]|nr:hypothetical protein [Paludibacteraceae bacterium]